MNPNCHLPNVVNQELARQRQYPGFILMPLDFTLQILDGFPFASLNGVEEFLLVFVEFNRLHALLPNIAGSPCGSA